MKLELKINSENKIIGYDLVPETGQEHNDLGQIRNLLFFGIEGTAIVYDGRKMKEGKEDSYNPQDIERLKFIQRKHQIS